jgi:predicted ATP-dependent serine protease
VRKMAWRCVHCGTEVYGEADRCPNCDENPRKINPKDLYPENPCRKRKQIAAFFKISPGTKKTKTP